MKSRISFLQFYLIIYLDLWKVSLLVVIIAQRHTFATHFSVNRMIYISLYAHVLHLKQFIPRSIIKFSFHTLFFSLSFFSYIYPTFILSCCSECLYLSDYSIDSFVYVFFYLFHFIPLFTSFILLVSSYLYPLLYCFSNFCLLSFFLTSYAIYLFSCRRVQEAGKSLMSDIAGFMGRLSNTTRGFPFPTNIRHGDMAFRKPFCFVILSRTISPMRFDDRGPSSAQSEFRFPRVSDSSVCFAPSLLVRSAHLSHSLPLSANATLGLRNAKSHRNLIQRLIHSALKCVMDVTKRRSCINDLYSKIG